MPAPRMRTGLGLSFGLGMEESMGEFYRVLEMFEGQSQEQGDIRDVRMSPVRSLGLPPAGWDE